ncbi:MAG: DUF1611 domain-containing protein [Actinomycetota bacterium]|nr:DUF1611 domain-containing protein [Actinomycetota bacterium]
MVTNGPRRWAILTDGYLTERNAKTAHGVLRYGRDEVVCVIDEKHAGRSVTDVMPELGRDVPVVGSVTAALALQPTSLLLGVATPGGWLPEHWRKWIVEALEAGLEIVNGLHKFLRDDPELVALAQEHGGSLWDVRDPPKDIPLFSGKPLELDKQIVATVGSDCAVGKKTTALELAAAGRAAGTATEFVATGQTGILIAGKGIAVDRVIADFLPGAAEKLVCDTHVLTEVVVVEGQGSLWHPAYSAVTLGLLHGSCPHALVLCHQAGRQAIEEPPYTPLPPLSEMVQGYERIAAVTRPARVACVSLNTKGLDRNEARAEIKRVEDETGLPAGDVVAGDAPKLWAAVAEVLAAGPMD